MYETLRTFIKPLVKNITINDTSITDFTWLFDFEEVCPHMYKDNIGNVTVGIGHNIDGNEKRLGVNQLAFELQNPSELKNTSSVYLKKLGDKFKEKLKPAFPTTKQAPSLLLDLITNPAKLNVHFFASFHSNVIKKISFKDLILFEYDHLDSIPKGKTAEKYRSDTILNLRSDAIVKLFVDDINAHYGALRTFPRSSLPQEIQKGLIDLAFNAGGDSINKWGNLSTILHKAVKAENKEKGALYLEAVLESRRDPANKKHPEIRNIFVAECFFWVAARYFKQSGVSISDTENKLKDGLTNYRANESFKKNNKYTAISNDLENKILLIAKQA